MRGSAAGFANACASAGRTSTVASAVVNANSSTPATGPINANRRRSARPVPPGPANSVRIWDCCFLCILPCTVLTAESYYNLSVAPCAKFRACRSGELQNILSDNWFGDGLAVGTRVGRSVIGLGPRIVQDRLSSSHFLRILAADADFVAAFG